MFTGPVGPVEVFFYWPEAVFGNIYWPGAIGPLLASSPVSNWSLPTYPFFFSSKVFTIRQDGQHDGSIFLDYCQLGMSSIVAKSMHR